MDRKSYFSEKIQFSHIRMESKMKKKLGVIITLLTLCICLMTPQMHAKAASGKTTIAVSAGSLNIGQTVTVTAKALSASGDSAYANMVLTYDAGILEFVSCNAT